MLRNVRLRRLAGRWIMDGSNTERFREMPGNRRCSPGCASVPVLLSLFSASRLKSSNHLPPGYFSSRCLNSSLTTSRPRLTPVCINYTWPNTALLSPRPLKASPWVIPQEKVDAIKVIDEFVTLVGIVISQLVGKNLSFEFVVFS